MSSNRNKLVSDAINIAYLLIDYDKNEAGQYESVKQIILTDESLTNNEKLGAINIISKDFDRFKILDNVGTKRNCENCQKECLAELYCEHCFRNYLEAQFSKWTSENEKIDNIIQKCQMETISPDKIIEWIPYNNLQNIKYLTKGGCSEIYTADWIDGRYEEWDSKGKQLKRVCAHEVVLKKLENIEYANRNWFDEFCGLADVPLNGTYGNFPYIAPEIIAGKETTTASDIYIIGMLMWEISSGQPPFINSDNDFDLALKIINGMRPIIIPGTPFKFKKLMKQCWDVDSTKRPTIFHLDIEIFEINKLYYQNDNDEQFNCVNINDMNISLKSANSLITYHSIQQDLIIPDSKYISGYKLENNDSNVKMCKDKSERIYSNDLESNKLFLTIIEIRKIKLSKDKEIQIDNKGEFNYIRENYVTNTSMNDDDDDDIYNNPNLHSEEQDELEIF
ncbi:hypothetical protein C1646_750712 [Rhizophagus diaphanus]|nr:hypothetical protein C1646_750712 [Rhizophagus diaphanus] [Rhizophagus sp. MUCL 43196]